MSKAVLEQTEVFIEYTYVRHKKININRHLMHFLNAALLLILYLFERIVH